MILIFKKINFLALIIGMVGKLFRCRVYYMSILPVLSTSIGIKILHLLHFRPISFDEVKFFDGNDFCCCGGIEASAVWFDNAVNPAMNNLARHFPNIVNLEHKLRSWYLKIMAYFYFREKEFLVWAEAVFPKDTKIYYFCSPIAKKFVESKRLQIVPVPFIEVSIFFLIKKIFTGIYSFVGRIFVVVKFQFMPKRVKCFSNQTIKQQVLFFPHKSIFYGKLFRKDYFYSEELKSAFHITNIHHIEIGDSRKEWDVPEDAGEYGSVNYTIFPGVRGINKKTIVSSIKLIPVFYKALNNSQIQVYEKIKLAVLLWIMHTIFLHYRQLLKPYSHAKIAILGYDILSSKGCSLALESYGIKTIAVLERMASVFQERLPTFLNVYLVGSEYCIKQIKKSPGIHADRYIPLGQARVDLFHKYSQLKSYNLVPGMKEGQKLVIALNFHSMADPDVNRLLHDISWESNKVFFNDIIELAQLHHDMFFLFRGKDCTWIDMSAFSKIMTKIDSIENITVDTDFDTLERSYMLCSSCDLIIARHTSLADEAYTYGKQVIVHDYNHNSNRIVGGIFNYLDSGLFVWNKELLHKLFENYVSTGSVIDPELYESVRKKLFGDYSDGKVRERIQAIADEMLVEAD
jgi:hypothetical protein